MMLGALTVIAGLLWLWLYARGGRLLPLILSHILLAVLAHSMLPERLMLSMRVGADALPLLARHRWLAADRKWRIVRVLASSEYFAHCGGTDPAFARALYRDAFGASPNPLRSSAGPHPGQSLSRGCRRRFLGQRRVSPGFRQNK
ncbi:MAG: hypothetical protein HY000_21075 [Planctomycetes bacterium]|nr:hypothetical protein [Planctomycetota bacterium]